MYAWYALRASAATCESSARERATCTAGVVCATGKNDAKPEGGPLGASGRTARGAEDEELAAAFEGGGRDGVVVSLDRLLVGVLVEGGEMMRDMLFDNKLNGLRDAEAPAPAALFELPFPIALDELPATLLVPATLERFC